MKSGMMLTTEAMIADIPEEKGGDHMGGMGGMGSVRQRAEPIFFR